MNIDDPNLNRHMVEIQSFGVLPVSSCKNNTAPHAISFALSKMNLYDESPKTIDQRVREIEIRLER